MILLPDDCLFTIMLWLDPKSICAVSSVNQDWHRVSNFDVVWKTLFEIMFGKHKDLLQCVLPKGFYRDVSKDKFVHVFKLITYFLPLFGRSVIKAIHDGKESTHAEIFLGISLRSLKSQDVFWKKVHDIQRIIPRRIVVNIPKKGDVWIGESVYKRPDGFGEILSRSNKERVVFRGNFANEQINEGERFYYNSNKLRCVIHAKSWRRWYTFTKKVREFYDIVPSGQSSVYLVRNRRRNLVLDGEFTPFHQREKNIVMCISGNSFNSINMKQLCRIVPIFNNHFFL